MERFQNSGILYFCPVLFVSVMSISIAAIIMILTILLMIALSVKFKRTAGTQEPRMKFSKYLLLISVVSFAVSIAAGGNVPLRLILDLTVSIIPLMLATSVLWEPLFAYRVMQMTALLEVCLIVVRLLYLFGVLGDCHDTIVISIIVVIVLTFSSAYIGSFGRRVYDVKSLMMSCSVWTYLCQGVEMVYLISYLALNLILLHICLMTSRTAGLHVDVVMIFLAMEFFALGLRILFESAFVIFRRHEDIIVESMNLSQVETSASKSKVNELYKEIYERILLYFEMQKPFLNHELTINDLVSVVYSNKLYISKSISMYTGRNFCQFVNCYRVRYSMDLFREQPNLKVSELAVLSGFNTVVSFSTAFRLFVNETPSDWCRKERSKLLKMKK